MLEPQTRTIDGFTVTLTPMPAWQSLEVLQQLSKMIGPALSKLGGAAAAAQGDEVAQASALEGVAGALTGALSALKPAEVRELGQQLLKNCLVELDDTPGKQVPILKVFDTAFQGRILVALKIMAFSIEVNFGDFFAALRPALAAIGARVKAAAGPSSSPITSPSSGPAGGSSLPG